MRRVWLMLVVSLMVASGIAAVAAAQAPPGPPVPPKPPELGEGRGQVILTWDEFVKITGYDPARKGGQVVTIPWAEVEKLLDVKIDQQVKSATVDLPWTEFKALLEWSISRKEKEAAPPPTDYIITSSRFSGTLSDEKADFTLTMKVNVLREKGWKRIPLLPSTVALTKTTVPEGAHVNSSGNAYELLTDRSGAMDLTLEFSVAVEKTAGINQVAFPRVAPGSSILDLTIERENVDVKVAGSQKMATTSARNQTVVAAAIPSGVPVTISWERALPKVEAVPSKLYAETRTLVAVAEGMLLCDEIVNFNILHTGVRELRLQVPAGSSILAVSAANLQDWRVDDKGELIVVLRNEVLGAYSLRVTYETAAKETAQVPVLRASNVEREKGYIAVIAVTNVEITAGEVTGAAAIDVRQLPADIVAMTNQPVLLAFRYVEDKFGIQLAIRKHEEVGVLVTIVDSGLFTAMQLNDGRRITKVVYTVRNNRNQFLRLRMPKKDAESAEIWSVSVSGNTVAPARDEQGNLLIPLIRSATSAAELASFPVEIVYIETPDKVAPAAGTIRVTLPTAAVPVMHLMYNYYLPAEGKYTVGWGKSGFSGPLRLVDEFAALSSGPGAEVIRMNAVMQAEQMQQQVDVRVDAEARKAGATPIRVRLPINGKLFKLEKILVLPQDEVWFDLEYSGWKVAQ